MRKHPQRLGDAGISEARYQELRAICRQYPGYVRHIRRVKAGIVDRPGRSGAWKRPDPTGNMAAANADALKWECARVRMIDDAAGRAAPPAVARAIVRNVTEGWSYQALRPPCGIRQFYDARMVFFLVLDELERGSHLGQ